MSKHELDILSRGDVLTMQRKPEFLVSFACIFLILLVLLPVSSLAEVRVDIRRGNIEPLPIAITEFNGLTNSETSIGGKISNVISNNLER